MLKQTIMNHTVIKTGPHSFDIKETFGFIRNVMSTYTNVIQGLFSTVLFSIALSSCGGSDSSTKNLSQGSEPTIINDPVKNIDATPEYNDQVPDSDENWFANNEINSPTEQVNNSEPRTGLQIDSDENWQDTLNTKGNISVENPNKNNSDSHEDSDANWQVSLFSVYR